MKVIITFKGDILSAEFPNIKEIHFGKSTISFEYYSRKYDWFSLEDIKPHSDKRGCRK